MAKEAKKRDEEKKENNQPAVVNTELGKIKAGLKANAKRLCDGIRNRVGAGDWKLAEIDCSIDNGKDSIDLVFSSNDGKKENFVIADISIPHLEIGQKYELPGKAKYFIKEKKVAAARLKKAIVLIRKGTASISTQPSRIRCPIIELQLESIVRAEKPVERPQQARNDNRSRPDNKPAPARNQQSRQNQEKEVSAPKSVSPELLFALKEAIVHECLSTMHKRCNKYIRKGLWRWIEREIMDPNVHFYLIILSSIYQGKTGEILSRRFKTVESYSSNPDEIINALFSRENNLADEIKHNAERHKKALTKFLACFSQTPPLEYLKSIFLKDFRTTNDGLKARMAVYSTLMQLLERCGFEGEKETRYPLEILDELKVFQGLMTGNYATLRTDNASKKLKHLVPQIEWTNEEIYQLRNQLAKALNLPSQEFNLNAFLPQAFMHDARHLAESRKEAIRSHTPNHDKRENNQQIDRNAKPDQSKDVRRQPLPEAQRDSRREPQNDRDRNQRHNNNDRNQPRPEKPAEAATATEKPINLGAMIESQHQGTETVEADRGRRRVADLDESCHRYFESFGGQIEEDIDSVRLALAMERHRLGVQNAPEIIAKSIEQEDIDETAAMPSKPGLQSRVVDDMPPPKRSRPRNNTDRKNGTTQRTDRKRRFSRSNSPRNKPRRPSSGAGTN